MKKTKIIIAAVAVLVVLALSIFLIVRCGGDSEENKPGETTSQPESGKKPGGENSKPGTSTNPGGDTKPSEKPSGNSVESPACVHEAVTDAAVEATCTEDGKTEGSHCAKCGEVLVAQEIIPATGHTEVIDEAVEATCTADGKTEGKHCAKCGEVLVSQEIIPAGHTPVVDAGVEATCTTEGITGGSHCAKCGEILVAQEVIPAGHIFVDGKCTRCGLETSKGLKYTLNADGESYYVSGIGDCTDTDLVIPSTHPDDGKPITGIGYQAFYNKKLTSVIIPNGVTYIETMAFQHCYSLENITIPDSVISIGNSAFGNTAYMSDESNWENGALYIGNCLIAASVSGSYSIREGTVCIGAQAFSYRKELTSVTIPDSVISIGSNAFYNCSGLTSITIGNGVTRIGNWAFQECKELTSITYKGTKVQWETINKGTYWKMDSSFTVYCTDGEIAY